jgi:hypothetical protein
LVNPWLFRDEKKPYKSMNFAMLPLSINLAGLQLGSTGRGDLIHLPDRTPNAATWAGAPRADAIGGAAAFVPGSQCKDIRRRRPQTGAGQRKIKLQFEAQR